MGTFNRVDAMLTPVAQIGPVAAISSDGATNGATIDKQALSEVFDEALFVSHVGATSGSPTSFSVVTKIQDSANGSNWDDVTDTQIVEAATKTISAINTVSTLAVRLSALRRYVRMVETVTLTGGSSPTVFIYGMALLGHPRRS